MQRAMKSNKGLIKILIVIAAVILLITGVISMSDFMAIVGGAV